MPRHRRNSGDSAEDDYWKKLANFFQKELQTAEAQVKSLKEQVEETKQGQDKMRSDYHQELMTYKSRNTANQDSQNNNITVQYFNSLEGIDIQTLKVVNDKIREVKDQADRQITHLTETIKNLTLAKDVAEKHLREALS